ncbi:MAG: Asp/Glu/hydantoin racemase [Bacteroidota bacterium]
MKKRNNLVTIVLALSLMTGCRNSQKQNVHLQASAVQGDIVNTILYDKDDFFHIDFEKYPIGDTSLPIGVFDSGTGGLTVLKALVNYDRNNNQSLKKGRDGELDFKKEAFIYLGDQANMPYGNYSEVAKEDLLREHIIKDAQFLLGNQYFARRSDTRAKRDKKPVKALVIACNTATAYGKDHIEAFLQQADTDIKVIGVIDAGVRGTLEGIRKDEDAIVGVLATAGTVASKGYSNTLLKLKDELGYTGKIEVFSQGGVGIAEAVDEDPDYYDRALIKPRDSYKGPGLEGPYPIDRTLLDSYNFDFAKNKMLCDGQEVDDCSNLQINDAENYVRYHLVSLLEQIRASKTTNQLKSLILGCTHYPYLTQEINKVLQELYNHRTADGGYRYRPFMAAQVALVDPALDTAKELFAHLKAESLFNTGGNMGQSEFYISVANRDNANNVIDSLGRFPYAFKYGRNAGEIQQYVKVVPFSRNTISKAILQRFKKQIPRVYELMETFNASNEKCNTLTEDDRI